MFKKGYIMSEEHRNRISMSLKGNTNSKGSLHSIETKNKLRLLNLGKKLSEKTKLKISEARKGKKALLETRLKMSESHKGHFVSEETRRKIGLAHKDWTHPIEVKRKMSEDRSGIKSNFWLGGKSFEPYNSEFNRKLKKKIRERDKYTCQECGFTEGLLGYHLVIHHIDYNKQNNNINNLVSLCKSCHGQTNYKRDDWTEYFKFRGAR